MLDIWFWKGWIPDRYLIKVGIRPIPEKGAGSWDPWSHTLEPIFWFLSHFGANFLILELRIPAPQATFSGMIWPDNILPNPIFDDILVSAHLISVSTRNLESAYRSPILGFYKKYSMIRPSLFFWGGERGAGLEKKNDFIWIDPPKLCLTVCLRLTLIIHFFFIFPFLWIFSFS